jgi:hypothetical protein
MSPYQSSQAWIMPNMKSQNMRLRCVSTALPGSRASARSAISTIEAPNSIVNSARIFPSEKTKLNSHTAVSAGPSRP